MAPRGFLGSKKPSIFERAHDSPQLVCSGLARADLFESPTGQLWRSILFCLPSAFCIVPKFVYGFNLHRPNTTIPRKEWSLRSARDLVTPHPADDGRATNERTVSAAVAVAHSVAVVVDLGVREVQCGCCLPDDFPSEICPK